MDWAFDIAGVVASVALLLALTRPGSAAGHVVIFGVATVTLLGLMGVAVGAIGMALLIAAAFRLLPPPAPRSTPAAQRAAGVLVAALTLAALAWRVDPAGGTRLGQLADPGALLAKVGELYLYELGALTALAAALYAARSQIRAGSLAVGAPR